MENEGTTREMAESQETAEAQKIKGRLSPRAKVWIGALGFVAIVAALGGPDQVGKIILGMVIILASVALYFLPSILAYIRGVSSPGSVLVVNIFFGWTFIGWVVALAMAARSPSVKSADEPSSPQQPGRA